MKCPSCQYVNPAMTARCVQRRTTLEHEGVGHGDLYRQGVRNVDTRILSGVGGAVGAALGVMGASMATDTPPGELWRYPNLRLIVLGCVVAGGVVGRLVAWRKNRWL